MLTDNVGKIICLQLPAQFFSVLSRERLRPNACGVRQTFWRLLPMRGMLWRKTLPTQPKQDMLQRRCAGLRILLNNYSVYYENLSLLWCAYKRKTPAAHLKFYKSCGLSHNACNSTSMYIGYDSDIQCLTTLLTFGA